MIMDHTLDMQVFHTDDPKAVYNPTGLLMGEVSTLELRTFMHTRNDLTMRAALGCAFGKFGMLALYLCQCLLFTAKKTRVLYLFCIGERCKRLEANVNSYLFGTFGQTLWFAFTRKSDVPLPCTALVNGSSFDGATYRTVIDQFHASDFGEGDTALMRDAETALGVG
jgi:hypothetical protein